MIQAFHTAASGLSGQQKNIDIIANNVANINTFGFKQSRLDFQDMMYNRMVNQVDNGEHMNLQHGTGVRPLQMNTLFLQGNAVTTERALDFMLQGNGFFNIEGDDGETLYTRDGTFKISVETDANYLVTSDGKYVLDADGERIQLTGDYTRMNLSPDGYIRFEDEEGNLSEANTLRLGISDFINPAGLSDAGNNRFRATENSGDPEQMDADGTFGAPNVKNFALEGSNVDYGREATRLIRAQRAYQLASRAVTTADQMMGLANSIRQ
ncbi:flagellar basal body rod protein FlgG [Clostridia bacterium]|nr:flagellar basal body rod protein FlgG [Clostridia bacterium]